MRLQILDLAKDDIIDGFHFYEAKEDGLGDYLNQRIHGAMRVWLVVSSAE